MTGLGSQQGQLMGTAVTHTSGVGCEWWCQSQRRVGAAMEASHSPVQMPMGLTSRRWLLLSEVADGGTGTVAVEVVTCRTFVSSFLFDCFFGFSY